MLSPRFHLLILSLFVLSHLSRPALACTGQEDLSHTVIVATMATAKARTPTYPSGANGSCAHPFAFADGRYAMRCKLNPSSCGLRNAAPGGAFTLLFLPGVYEFSQTLRLGATDSPAYASPAAQWPFVNRVVWSAETSGQVIFSGGLRTSSSSCDGHDSCFAPAGTPPGTGQPDAIWALDGTRLPPARTPSFTYNIVTSGLGYVELEVPQGGLSTDARLVVDTAWAQHKLRVIGVNRAYGRFSTGDWGATVKGVAGTYRLLTQTAYYEGSQGLLTQPGYFWWNREGRAIVTKGTGTYVVPQITEILRLEGAHDVAFSGIQFMHNTGDNSASYVNYQGELLGGAGQSAAPAAVTVNGGSNFVFNNVTFAHLGTTAMVIHGASFVWVNSSNFSDIGGSAISVSPYGNTSYLVDLSQNEISNVGVNHAGSVGIFSRSCWACLVQFNHLSNLPYTGISYGWDGLVNGGGSSIRNNKVENIMTELIDGGGIYVRGAQERSGRLSVYQNSVVNFRSGLAAQFTPATANSIRNPYEAAFYLDESASGTDVVGNYAALGTVAFKLNECRGVRGNTGSYNRFIDVQGALVATQSDCANVYASGAARMEPQFATPYASNWSDINYGLYYLDGPQALGKPFSSSPAPGPSNLNLFPFDLVPTSAYWHG